MYIYTRCTGSHYDIGRQQLVLGSLLNVMYTPVLANAPLMWMLLHIQNACEDGSTLLPRGAHEYVNANWPLLEPERKQQEKAPGIGRDRELSWNFVKYLLGLSVSAVAVLFLTAAWSAFKAAIVTVLGSITSNLTIDAYDGFFDDLRKVPSMAGFKNVLETASRQVLSDRHIPLYDWRTSTVTVLSDTNITPGGGHFYKAKGDVTPHKPFYSCAPTSAEQLTYFRSRAFEQYSTIVPLTNDSPAWVEVDMSQVSLVQVGL
jgi:hypothetical protein